MNKLPLIHLLVIMSLGKNNVTLVIFIKVTLKAHIFRVVLKHKGAGKKISDRRSSILERFL